MEPGWTFKGPAPIPQIGECPDCGANNWFDVDRGNGFGHGECAACGMVWP